MPIDITETETETAIVFPRLTERWNQKKKKEIRVCVISFSQHTTIHSKITGQYSQTMFSTNHWLNQTLSIKSNTTTSTSGSGHTVAVITLLDALPIKSQNSLPLWNLFHSEDFTPIDLLTSSISWVVQTQTADPLNLYHLPSFGELLADLSS